MKKPVSIFSDKPQLNCEYCGKNLLEDTNCGNFIVFKKEASEGQGQNELNCIKYACKEHDGLVADRAKVQGLIDAGWDDVDDLLIPTIWIRKFMAFINEMYELRDNMSLEYFNDVKKMFLNTFPYIAREMTTDEVERVSRLLQIEF